MNEFGIEMTCQFNTVSKVISEFKDVFLCGLIIRGATLSNENAYGE